MFDDDGTCMVCGLENAPEDHFHDADILRDGARGQYLSPTFVLDAYGLLNLKDDELTNAASRWLDEMGHGGSATEDDYDHVLDSLSNLESDLDSAGFVVSWDDGYVIWKVENDANA